MANYEISQDRFQHGLSRSLLITLYNSNYTLEECAELVQRTTGEKISANQLSRQMKSTRDLQGNKLLPRRRTGIKRRTKKWGVVNDLE